MVYRSVGNVAPRELEEEPPPLEEPELDPDDDLEDDPEDELDDDPVDEDEDDEDEPTDDEEELELDDAVELDAVDDPPELEDELASVGVVGASAHPVASTEPNASEIPVNARRKSRRSLAFDVFVMSSPSIHERTA